MESDDSVLWLEPPTWAAIAGTAMWVLAIFVAVIVAHMLSRKKIPGGKLMLVSIYGAIVLSLSPMATFSLLSSDGENSFLYWGANLGSQGLVLVAALSGLKAVQYICGNNAS